MSARRNNRTRLPQHMIDEFIGIDAALGKPMGWSKKQWLKDIRAQKRAKANVNKPK